MACTNGNYRLEAVSPTWGKENRVKVVPVTGLTGGESLWISSQTTDYEVWFSVDSSGAAPGAAGRTSIEVALPAAYTVADANDAIISALTSGEYFYVDEDVDSTYVCIDTLDIGAPNAAAADVDTGFTITTTIAGFALALGNTVDGVEISTEATLFDVIPNQTGSLADQIIQGFSVTASMGLIQLTADVWEKILGEGYGSNFTSGLNTYTGLGTGKNFTSSFDYAGRLILHPVRLDASDRSEDINLWKTVAAVESVNYSGTDLQTMALSFNALVDSSKDEGVNLMLRGDSSKYIA